MIFSDPSLSNLGRGAGLFQHHQLITGKIDSGVSNNILFILHNLHIYIKNIRHEGEGLQKYVKISRINASFIENW